MKRTFDVVAASLALLVGLLPLVLIALLVRLTSRGPVLYWSDRVGRGNQLFWMPKFRTMRIDTPEVATHLLTDPTRWLTPIGNALRRTSLDELPQLWCILTGEMSLVGPRPALFNQDDLIALRTAANIHDITPGLTGWAQINGRDEATIPEKVALDAWYRDHASLAVDLKIIFRTAWKVARRDGIATPESLRNSENENRRKAA
jgi:O-antigen biosynthesis protein WbqP